MDIAGFVDLFKSYCQKYRYREVANGPVKNLQFLHFDVDDLTGALRDLSLPALFLTTPEVDFGGENTDAISESYELTFMVLLQLPDNDIRRKAEVIQNAKIIADNFIRRMLYEAGSEILEGLNIPGIKAGPVGRTATNLYGWEVSFNIKQDFDGELQTEVWEDLA